MNILYTFNKFASVLITVVWLLLALMSPSGTAGGLDTYVLKFVLFLFCLLFWNRPCFQDLLDPLGRYLSPQQVWPPHLPVEVLTRSMLTRWSAQTPGTRSSMPFYSLWAGLCPANLRTLSEGTGQRAVLKMPCRETRRWLSFQPPPKQLSQIRTWRGMQYKRFQKRHRKQHPLAVQATPGVAPCSSLKLSSSRVSTNRPGQGCGLVFCLHLTVAHMVSCEVLKCPWFYMLVTHRNEHRCSFC